MDKPMYDIFSILYDPYHVINMMEEEDNETDLAGLKTKYRRLRNVSRSRSVEDS